MIVYGIDGDDQFELIRGHIIEIHENTLTVDGDIVLRRLPFGDWIDSRMDRYTGLLIRPIQEEERGKQ